jgi:hypothetical protein
MWLNGIVYIDKRPYYRLLPTKDNYIEIKTIKNHSFLVVNEKNIYDHSELFGYTIHLTRNSASASASASANANANANANADNFYKWMS